MTLFYKFINITNTKIKRESPKEEKEEQDHFY